MSEFWEDGLILRVLAGSRAHGLAREGSDTDTRGVCIPPVRHLIGLGEFEQHTSDDGDHVTFALAKFVRLGLQGNPNILECLYTHEDDILFIDEDGRALLDERDCFLSKAVGERFMGYALGQLKRMERHHRWLVEPPTAPPRPEEFDGKETDGRFRFPHNDAKKAYDAAVKHWNHFQTWRKERNPARAELEEKHGYDTKHAMHLARLLKMGAEVLAEGTLTVRRPDAEWLHGIRDGAYTYGELLELSNEMTATLDRRMAESSLPDRPDAERAEELLIRLTRKRIERG